MGNQGTDTAFLRHQKYGVRPLISHLRLGESLDAHIDDSGPSVGPKTHFDAEKFPSPCRRLESRVALRKYDELSLLWLVVDVLIFNFCFY
jgi:hypothetical protein